LVKIRNENNQFDVVHQHVVLVRQSIFSLVRSWYDML